MRLKEYLIEVNNKEEMGWDDKFIEDVYQHALKKHGGFVEYGNDYKKLVDNIYGIYEDYSGINFNDEIESIELVGEEELYDIEVSHDNLFYANDILTHNSAMGNMDAGMESISESLKIAMTADVAIFLINSDQMREQNQQIWKIVKNRYTGEMPSLMMSANFARMTYQDFAGEDGSTFSKEAINQIGEQSFGGSDINTGLDFGRLNFG